MADNPTATQSAANASDAAADSTGVAANMPYTALILEGEAKQRENNPDAQVERPEHLQFIIDQEAAVQRDFDSGRISQADYDSFRELSTERVEEIRAEVGVEVDEYVADVKETLEPRIDELKGELDHFKEMTDPHRDQMEELNALASSGQLDAGDVPLGLAADVIEPSLDVAETGVDMMDDVTGLVGEHLPEIVDVAVDNSQETAHAFIDARANMEGVDQAEISAAREQLGALDAGLDEQMDTFNKEFDGAMERADDYYDWQREQIDEGRDQVDAIRDYVEEHPDATVEDYPGRVEQPVDSEEDMGIADA
jgi:hypothetical protein